MINEMHEMGLPDPEFSKHFDVMVVFRNGVVAEETSELNPRQQTGLQIVRDKGSISTSEYVAATGAPARTAYRDLQDLVERDLLVVRGKRRGTRYYLVYGVGVRAWPGTAGSCGDAASGRKVVVVWTNLALSVMST